MFIGSFLCAFNGNRARVGIRVIDDLANLRLSDITEQAFAHRNGVVAQLIGNFTYCRNGTECLTVSFG